MIGKVNRLRNQGKRLSDQDIGRSQFTAGEIRLSGLGDTLVLTVTDANSTVGASLLPQLFEARLTTMHGSKMLFKGEERPQGDAGPAYVQEWSVLLE
jgi:hypothetical protein